MKKKFNMLRFSRYFTVLLAFLIIAYSCAKDKDKDPDPVEIQNRKINDWILETMEACYYWNEQIPGKTDKKLSPEKYFESLIYEGDEFSIIYENFAALMALLSGVNIEAGYDFNLFRVSETDIMGYITYIKPGTPAEKAGLQRGDYFMTINNEEMNVDNINRLYQEMSKSHTLGIADFEESVVYNVALNVIVYEENPILLDTVYQDINGKKIGYFVYNFFARDSKDNGIGYEKELNELFGKFSDEGIDELIIDLRYNSGGTIITAMALASMISGRSSDDILGYEEYNSLLSAYFERRDGSDYNKMYFLDYIVRTQGNRTVETVPVNKLSGLNRVYMIVSQGSASASELLINCLRPYMPVFLVGETTRGKNVGSSLFYDEDDPDNDWGMLPIILKLSNRDGFSDYANGFTPDSEDLHELVITEGRKQSEYELDMDMKPLGDTNERLLAATLDMIFGKQPLKRQNIIAKPEIIGSSIDRFPARKNMYITPSHKLK